MKTFILKIVMDATDEDDFINAVLEKKRRELHECTKVLSDNFKGIIRTDAPSTYDTMKCGCSLNDVAWDERVFGEACGCTSCVNCGLINTQDKDPQKWRCYIEHPRSCSQKEANE